MQRKHYAQLPKTKKKKKKKTSPLRSACFQAAYNKEGRMSFWDSESDYGKDELQQRRRPKLKPAIRKPPSGSTAKPQTKEEEEEEAKKVIKPSGRLVKSSRKPPSGST